MGDAGIMLRKLKTCPERCPRQRQKDPTEQQVNGMSQGFNTEVTRSSLYDT